ncbi:MAG: hypothetical protein JWM56_1012 [Candidatus Peribacteria bacterium]|nr:hypothetical protein [Candidatus Peribacteria bacterium]
MKLRILSRPSGKMDEQFGVDAGKHMQDQFVHQFDAAKKVLTLAGIDWANNYRGIKSAVDPSSAGMRGLPENIPLLPAEIGSMVAKRVIETHQLSGHSLISVINAELRKRCTDIGIIPPDIENDDARKLYLETHRAESMTGYIGHVRMDEETLRVTAVGDVFVRINGVLRAGRDKLIDVLKKIYIDDIATASGEERQKIHERYNPEWTLMQFEHMQNNPLAGDLYYPAIDGTDTPDFESVNMPVADVKSVLIHTDGLMPTGSVAHSIEDLKIVNARFNEQTALQLIAPWDWSELRIEIL